MKKTVSVILAILLLFCFSACGEDTASSSSAQSETNSKQPFPTASSAVTESKEESSVTESMVESTVSTPEEKPEPSYDLRVGSYNIANGSKVGHNMSVLAADITSKELDIVGIQEVDRNSSRAQYLDTMKVLSDLTGYKYYSFVKAVDLAQYGITGDYGVGILSKYPIVNEMSWQIYSASYEQRVLAGVEVDVNGKKVNFFTTHLTYNTVDIRKSQFEEVDSHMKNYENVILTGDFNVESVDEFSQMTTLTGVNNAQNPLESYIPNDWPTKCIDNIMYSKDFEYISSGMNVSTHSDHNMIYADFKIK